MSAATSPNADDQQTGEAVDVLESAIEDHLDEAQEAMEADDHDSCGTEGEEVRLPMQIRAEQTISVLMAMAPVAARAAVSAIAGKHDAAGEMAAARDGSEQSSHAAATADTLASTDVVQFGRAGESVLQADNVHATTATTVPDMPAVQTPGKLQSVAIAAQVDAATPTVRAERKAAADDDGKPARSEGKQLDAEPKASPTTGTTESHNSSSAGAQTGGDQPGDRQPDQQSRAPEARHNDPQPVAAKVSVIAQQTVPAPLAPTLATNAAAVVTAIAADQGWRLASNASSDALQSFRNAQPLRSLKIELHPAELGTVTANLRAAGEQLSVELQVESHDAYHRLSADSDAIVNSLRSLGYEIDRVSIQQPQAAGTTVARADIGSGAGSPARDGSSFQSGTPGNGGERSGDRAGGGRDRSDGQRNEQAPHSRQDRTGGSIYI